MMKKMKKKKIITRNPKKNNPNKIIFLFVLKIFWDIIWLIIFNI